MNKKLLITSISLIIIISGVYILVDNKYSVIKVDKCKNDMRCEYCKNGSYTEWDPKISDGAVTYYDSNGEVVTIVGGMKSSGNKIVEDFVSKCEVE